MNNIVYYIFTVDHTRVILEEVESGNTDYINANRIVQDTYQGSEEHTSNRKEYIATQGCMQNTRTGNFKILIFLKKL